MGRSGIKVEVSTSEQEQLTSMSRSRSLPYSLMRRAKSGRPRTHDDKAVAELLSNAVQPQAAYIPG